MPDITIEPIAPAETPKPSEPETPGIETPGADTSKVETEDVTKPEETKLVLEGDALGKGASFAYVPKDSLSIVRWESLKLIRQNYLPDVKLY